LGTSRRYADHFDRKMNDRILERVVAETTPSSLNDDELELDVQPLTKPPRALPVTAWVRYGETSVKVEGRAVAWTARAVAVQWKTAAGDVHRAWVWASAVTGG
jgi:hypothetical protein